MRLVLNNSWASVGLGGGSEVGGVCIRGVEGSAGRGRGEGLEYGKGGTSHNGKPGL